MLNDPKYAYRTTERILSVVVKNICDMNLSVRMGSQLHRETQIGCDCANPPEDNCSRFDVGSFLFSEPSVQGGVEIGVRAYIRNEGEIQIASFNVHSFDITCNRSARFVFL